MGILGSIINSVFPGAGSVGESGADLIQEPARARREAERQAAAQREALAQLQAEKERAIPLPDDEATRRARRRSIVEQLRRRGRASTILTNPDAGSDVLGA